MHARSPKLLEDIRDAAAFVGEVTTVLQSPALLRNVQALLAQQP